MKRVFAVVSLVSALSFLGALAVGAAEPTYIAGTKPDRRPEGAPVATATKGAAIDKAAALRGVEQPIPPSLKFLDDQGGWYTPFARAGMRGPYDIRGLHRGAQ